MPSRAKIDGIEVLQHIGTIRSHHLIGLQIVLASPRKHLNTQSESSHSTGYCLYYLKAFGQYLLSNPISGDGGNSVFFHVPSSPLLYGMAEIAKIIPPPSCLLNSVTELYRISNHTREFSRVADLRLANWTED